MPRSAGMRESGVRIVREKAMDGFFNTLPAVINAFGSLRTG